MTRCMLALTYFFLSLRNQRNIRARTPVSTPEQSVEKASHQGLDSLQLV